MFNAVCVWFLFLCLIYEYVKCVWISLWQFSLKRCLLVSVLPQIISQPSTYMKVPYDRIVFFLMNVCKCTFLYILFAFWNACQLCVCGTKTIRVHVPTVTSGLRVDRHAVKPLGNKASAQTSGRELGALSAIGETLEVPRWDILIETV